MMHINRVVSLTVCFYIIYNNMVMVSKLISQYIVNKIRDIFHFFNGIFFLYSTGGWGVVRVTTVIRLSSKR